MLQYELRDDRVYVTGDWFLGEIRFQIHELSEYTTDKPFPKADVADSKVCKSCNDSKEYNTMHHLELSHESLLICECCKEELQEILRTVIEENKKELISKHI